MMEMMKNQENPDGKVSEVTTEPTVARKPIGADHSFTARDG